MVAIVDYGVGNIFSLRSSFAAIGADVEVTSDEKALREADQIILPGVGAFKDAAEKLEETGMAQLIKELAASGKPLLGICLGMQLLFERSYEYGKHNGLGLIKGCVRPVSDVVPKEYKIPHIGWNRLNFKNDACPIFKYINEGDYVYFVHSFYGTDCEASTVAVTQYGAELTAAVMDKNVFGCQFHPEKSGQVGLDILRAFMEVKEEK